MTTFATLVVQMTLVYSGLEPRLFEGIPEITGWLKQVIINWVSLSSLKLILLSFIAGVFLCHQNTLCKKTTQKVISQYMPLHKRSEKLHYLVLLSTLLEKSLNKCCGLWVWPFPEMIQSSLYCLRSSISPPLTVLAVGNEGEGQLYSNSALADL